MKSEKAKKIKLVAKRPEKIKAALQAWGKASDAIGADPLGLDAAPPWVEKAWMEVVKVVMPGNRIPVAGEMDLEMLGELFGRLQAFGNLYVGEIAVSPQVENECERFVDFAESQPKTAARKAKEKMLVRDFDARVAAMPKGIADLMGAALASSHEDSLKFQKGLLRGMNLVPDDLISANVFERHTRTFFVLAVYWRFWITCQSLGEIHRILRNAVGEDKIGNFKTFENRVAKKILLKVRGRGRPKGKK